MSSNLPIQYRRALKTYLAEGGEAPLHQAYELGREALSSGIGLLGLINIHYSSCIDLINGTSANQSHQFRATGHFLLESLSPFEMFNLGNKESNAALRRLNEILEEEAKRIAHALHDETAQLLATAYLEIAEIQHESPPASVGKRVDQLKSHLDKMREQLRLLSHELRSPILDQLGLLPALEYLAQGFQKRTGLKVNVETSVMSGYRLQQPTETALYRATQEALSNIARHAHATSVEIRVWKENGTVHWSISDDGIGFRVPTSDTGNIATGGLGLLGIRERINSLHGQFTVSSAPASGTELLISIPI
ncbi:MAG: ATP-binding protein [Gammaproteobacteria bacterium]